MESVRWAAMIRHFDGVAITLLGCEFALEPVNIRVGTFPWTALPQKATSKPLILLVRGIHVKLVANDSQRQCSTQYQCYTMINKFYATTSSRAIIDIGDFEVRINSSMNSAELSPMPC
jgi:hypothetical protein